MTLSGIRVTLRCTQEVRRGSEAPAGPSLPRGDLADPQAVPTLPCLAADLRLIEHLLWRVHELEVRNERLGNIISEQADRLCERDPW